MPFQIALLYDKMLKGMPLNIISYKKAIWKGIEGHLKGIVQKLEDSHFYTPSLVGRQCWGKTILPGAGYGLGTYRTVDIFNFSLISWTILEKKRFLCFYIIKSIARKGYFGPKYP